jgi:hypothetical protein
LSTELCIKAPVVGPTGDLATENHMELVS